jgi:hypothetical protein
MVFTRSILLKQKIELDQTMETIPKFELENNCSIHSIF